MSLLPALYIHPLAHLSGDAHRITTDLAVQTNPITSMRHTLVLALVCITTVTFAQTEEDRQALIHLKTVQWPKAYREQDTVLLKRILADEFQMIEASGEVSTKKLEVAYVKKNKPSYSSFTYTIQRLDIFENGTAIVSGTGLVKGTGKNGAYETTYASSNVLIKRHGQWQAIASHVSGVKRK